jgi:diguanylate cyclase (GGDEF)-like protein
MEDRPADPSGKPRILLMHESRIMRASITRHLKQAFECIEASDIDAAWRLLQDDPDIAVALVDLSLPREEGVQLIARLRDSVIPRISATPVVVIASDDGHPGNSVEEARQRARAAGALDFVSKASTPTEMLSRLSAAQKLSALQRELAAEKQAAALAEPVDPASGLMTAEYLEVAAQQAFAAAARGQTELAWLHIAIDGLDEIDARLGVPLSPVITREISKVMARLFRREDTLARVASGHFAALLPGVSVDDLAEKVGQWQKRLAAVAMRYAGEIIQVTVSVGAASRLADSPRDVRQMAELARQRWLAACAAGPGGFVGATAPPPAPVLAPAGSIDAALRLLQDKQADAIKPQLYTLALKLMPLLRVFEREFHLNFRLSRLKERATQARRGTPPEG